MSVALLYSIASGSQETYNVIHILVCICMRRALEHESALVSLALIGRRSLGTRLYMCRSIHVPNCIHVHL